MPSEGKFETRLAIGKGVQHIISKGPVAAVLSADEKVRLVNRDLKVPLGSRFASFL